MTWNSSFAKDQLEAHGPISEVIVQQTGREGTKIRSPGELGVIWRGKIQPAGEGLDQFGGLFVDPAGLVGGNDGVFGGDSGGNLSEDGSEQIWRREDEFLDRLVHRRFVPGKDREHGVGDVRGTVLDYSAA